MKPRSLQLLILFGCLQLTTSCSHPVKMTLDEFASLAPFKGKVTDVEKLRDQPPPTSISGPDYQVTVVKPNGGSIIITKISTSLFSASQLEKLTAKGACDLPKEIIECARNLPQRPN